MNAHELYGLLNSVPIVHSGTIFHQQIPDYFFLRKAEMLIPNKLNYVLRRDNFSLILDLTRNGKYHDLIADVLLTLGLYVVFFSFCKIDGYILLGVCSL